jgi:hypothetical protein
MKIEQKTIPVTENVKHWVLSLTESEVVALSKFINFFKYSVPYGFAETVIFNISQMLPTANSTQDNFPISESLYTIKKDDDIPF